MTSKRPQPKPSGRGSRTPGTGAPTGPGTTPGPSGTGSGHPGSRPPEGPGPDCSCLVMVPCTTNIKGKFKVGLHDVGGPENQSVEVECRVHAIAYRGAQVDVKAENPNAPDQPGTWYLITLHELEWKRNPMWIHEEDSRLNLGY